MVLFWCFIFLIFIFIPDLMNGCRVKEAKRLLVDQKLEHLSILGIGLEAGFNSKTTFNTTFKKFTGLTPTAYKNQAV